MEYGNDTIMVRLDIALILWWHLSWAVDVAYRSMEIVKTSHGKPMLCLNDYTYTEKKTYNGKIRWSCTRSRGEGCPGSLTTDAVPVANPRSFKNHSHGPDPGDVAVKKFRSSVREQAQLNYCAQTAAILASQYRQLPAVAIPRVTNLEAVKRDIQRQKARSRPPEPTSVQMINVQHPWTTTGGANPHHFLLYDSGPHPDRVIVFGADGALQHLAQATYWYMDGNFKMSPVIFSQVYVLRTHLDTGTISCVYAFLTGKDGYLYREMFIAIQQRMATLNVPWVLQDVMADFEIGAMNAVKLVFGNNIRIHGCFFHLCQSTWRKLCDLGLRQLYMNNVLVKKFVGMMDGLAFVPVNDLLMGVNFLAAHIPVPQLVPLFQYFVNTYVLGPIVPQHRPLIQPHVVRRAPPMFPPELWNVFDTTLANNSRTNNICEGWNRAFLSMANGVQHPPFYTVLECIQKDATFALGALSRSHHGQPHTMRVRRAYLWYQRNLRALCLQYNNGAFQNNIGQYLDRISNHIRF